MAQILIIDDENAIRAALREVLEYEGYNILEAEDGKAGLHALENENVDLIFCDVRMSGMDGLSFLEACQKQGFDVPIITITGHGTIDLAVQAFRNGAFDFIEKPLDLNRVLISTRNGLQHTELKVETKSLKKKMGSRQTGIIGSSESITQALKIIDTVAPTEARVMITGENGTGKELAAKRLHEKSSRAKGPFIEVNCAAIPSELIESELFGHEKGAFTSAIKTRIGKFELANGGTLFLDEIGDMSINAQAKVLRALQEQTILRVGGDKEIKVDVRIISATNKQLRKEIETGQFREDLYHRLAVIPIHLPSLKDRKEDIPELIQHFLELLAQEYGEKKKTITPEAIELLTALPWTGNIRELRNTIERLIILSGPKIDDKAVKDFGVLRY